MIACMCVCVRGYEWCCSPRDKYAIGHHPPFTASSRAMYAAYSGSSREIEGVQACKNNGLAACKLALRRRESTACDWSRGILKSREWDGLVTCFHIETGCVSL